MQIQRDGAAAAYSLTTSATTTPEIDVNNFAAGQVHVPTGSSITSLTYHAAPDKGGTYLPLQTSAGVAVTQTVAQTKAYDLPAQIAGCRYIRIVADAAGSVTIVGKT